jgi:hypothetical protein
MKYLLLLLVVAFMLACKPKHPVSAEERVKPDTLISRQKMILILTDVHLTEAAISFEKNRGGNKTGLTEEYYHALFSKYRISKNLFTANYDYYKADQEEMIRIYEEVIKKLDGMVKKSGGSQEE